MICTRGDVDLAPVSSGIPHQWSCVIWDNSQRRDMKVFGYFAALEEVQTDFVYTVADDTIVDAQKLLDEWTEDDRDRILLNTAVTGPWISFGAIFHRNLPDTAFRQYGDSYGWGDDQLLWCEVIFTSLTEWRGVDIGAKHLPWHRAANRMCVMPTHYPEQARVRENCRELLVAA